VVLHTSVLYQVPPARRREFAALVGELPGRWLANDVPTTDATFPAPPDGADYNLLALDGRPLAWTRSHGQSMTWFGPLP
jgi:hypothetical protein